MPSCVLRAERVVFEAVVRFMLRWTLVGRSDKTGSGESGSGKNRSGRISDASGVAVVPLNTALREHVFDGKCDTRAKVDSPPPSGASIRQQRRSAEVSHRRSFVEETTRVVDVGGRGESGSRDPSQGQPLGTHHSWFLRPTPLRTLRVPAGDEYSARGHPGRPSAPITPSAPVTAARSR